MAKVEKRIDTLITVVNELQELCGFEPAMKTKGQTEKALEKQIKDASEQLTPEDEISATTKKVFKELGLSVAAKVAAKETEEEEEAEEEEEVEKPAKKGKAAKAEPEEEEEAEEEEEVEKPAKKGKATPAKKEAPAKKGKAAPVPAKKAAPAKAAKKEKSSREKTKLGTVLGTGASKIDLVLIENKGKWISSEDIVKKGKVDASRINTHINFLNKEGRATVEIKKEGKSSSYKLTKIGA